jgi:signal recognition particle receptor subunit beta
MAHFDSHRGEVVVRIVYDGLATAGKTANLRSLHAAYLSRTKTGIHVSAETSTGRTLYFDWLELQVGYLDDWPLRCQILTVPGQFAYAERRFRLLREIDGVVLVCESTAKGIKAARIASVFLGKVLDSCGNADVPIVFQANKQDLPEALGPADVAARLGLGAARPILPASAASGDGVRMTLLTVLGLARDRLRERLRRSGVQGLRSHTESAEELYTAMLAEEDAEETEAISALEAALRAADGA